jgi:hypothetical protein
VLRFSTVAGQDGSWSLTARASTYRAVYGSCGRRLVALGRQRLEGHVGVVLLVVRGIILAGFVVVSNRVLGFRLVLLSSLYAHALQRSVSSSK